MKLYKTKYSDNFNLAFTTVIEVETTKITNTINDAGGLTLCGISRNAFPDLPLWRYVDSGKLKIGNTVPDKIVETEVADVYYNNFWNKFSLDEVNYILAYEIFEQAINIGARATIRNLQKALNTLNFDTKTNSRVEVDLTVDGLWGRNTKARLLKYKSHYEFLAKSMNVLQGTYYIDLAHSKVLNRTFIKGWLDKRVELKHL